MKKILFLLLGICISAFSVERFEIKSGVVMYDITGEGTVMGAKTKVAGKSTLVFKEYGDISLQKEKTKQETMGQVDTDESIIKYEGDKFYMVNHEQKVILIGNTKEFMVKDMEDFALFVANEKNLKKSGAKKIAQEKVAGYTCDVWQLKDGSLCIYKGVPLKLSLTVMGITQHQVAKDVQFDIKVEDELLKLPDYPHKTQQNIMDNMIKEQLKNATPEEKKMMQKMMQEMMQNTKN